MSVVTESLLSGSTATERPLQLLLVEDNRGDARLLEEHLGEIAGLEPELTWVRTRDEAMELLVDGQERFDLVFLDLHLPDSARLETVESVLRAASDIPVVVLTGQEDSELASEAVSLGVQDYLVKGRVTPEDLTRAIRTALERKRIHRKLEEERAQLQQIIDEAPAFMALYMGPDHVLEQANDAWYELVGPRDAVGKPVREIFPEFGDQKPLERLDRVYRTGKPIQVRPERLELEGDDGDSETHFLRIAYQPRVVDGEVVGVIVHGVDITETILAQRTLSAQREELRGILETVAEGIVFTDASGDIQFANAAAERIMGLEAAEITDRAYTDPSWDVTDLDGDPIPEEQLALTRVLRHGKRVDDVEFAIRTGDGGRAVLSVNAAPLLGEDDRIEGAVASFRDVTGRRQLEEQLRRRALHDNLTELPNRVLFEDRLEQAIHRARRTEEGFALAYLDLKRFKVVNDNLGHAAGDRVLREIARRLQRVVREADTVARIGGDEFTVILGGLTDRDAAAAGVERLVDALDEPVDLGQSAVPVDATIGVALCLDPATRAAVDASDLLRQADSAMYAAKDRPGTAFSFAEDDRELRGTGRFEREQELRRALDEEQIRTVYQPIYDAHSREIRGVEALARWHHPERGTVSPGDFIPLAEETGLIIRLGQQQLARACSTLLALQSREGLTAIPRLHVNLSARQLLDPDVVGRVRSVLQETSFPVERLTLEITESAAIREAGVLDDLRSLGVEVAIDDFGTQYSSLAQVKQLQVDSIKIDRSFVVGLPEAVEDRAIVQTVITLGKTLGLDVVAEGVETEEQMEFLTEVGCGQIQGFLLSEPVSDEELRQTLGPARHASA